ncbi:MAG TPA: hypothetical protein VF086_07795 [Propionibacteriaceae bacterium]
MRALRVAADIVQLTLPDLGPARPVERWWSLPEATRREVLTLLARLIARGVLIAPDTAADGWGDGDE